MAETNLLDSFKLWGEQVFGWYYLLKEVFTNQIQTDMVTIRKEDHKKRLINKQYLIVGRGAAKLIRLLHASIFLNVDTTTTHQITTAPTMKQAEAAMGPIRTAITRSRGPLFKFLTEGSLQNTTDLKLTE